LCEFGGGDGRGRFGVPAGPVGLGGDGREGGRRHAEPKGSAFFREKQLSEERRGKDLLMNLGAVADYEKNFTGGIFPRA
jgi:hypothetical protein